MSGSVLIVKNNTVDELARKKELEEVKEQFRLLYKIYDGGKTDPDMWHKSLIFMSYRFARINAMDDCIDLLALLPEEWFTTTLYDEMERDLVFAATAQELANLLINAGVVGMDAKSAMDQITQFTVGKA